MAELLCLARFDYTFFVIFRQDFCYNILGTIDYVYSLALKIMEKDNENQYCIFTDYTGKEFKREPYHREKGMYGSKRKGGGYCAFSRDVE